MTREQLQTLADTAEERTTGHLRVALKDPKVRAAIHSRYVPAVMDGPSAAAVANDPSRGPAKGRERA